VTDGFEESHMIIVGRIRYFPIIHHGSELRNVCAAVTCRMMPVKRPSAAVNVTLTTVA